MGKSFIHRFSCAITINVFAFVTFAPAVDAAVIYSGSLSSTPDNTGALQGIGDWLLSPGTTIQWWVTDNGQSWHYKYVLAVPYQEVSHIIVEVSDEFTEENFWNATGNFDGTSIDDFDQNNGNSHIPTVLHGLKFDNTVGMTLSIEFDSDRRPVWGDFYAKDGGNPPHQIWNAGITSDDPNDPPSSGSIENHLLVPDTLVPEPATLAMVAAGGLVCVLRRRCSSAASE